VLTGNGRAVISTVTLQPNRGRSLRIMATRPQHGRLEQEEDHPSHLICRAVMARASATSRGRK